MLELPYNVLISHAGKVMPKILQARCQRCINQDLPDVQDGFWRSRGIRDQIVNAGWQKKQENSRKTSTSASLTTLKPLTVWIITICGKLLIPDHLACLLRNLYVSQEATVRTWHGTMDCFQIGKGVCQDCILSPGLFNLYAEYVMLNAGLDEAQARIKFSRRNINNLRYADDPILMEKVKRN